ncbi:MAG: rod shape-determining protein MreC, partial [Actinobacteria bacterium]|nr:rod shape-determining protein MreC [Actinomycetota bacterium]
MAIALTLAVLHNSGATVPVEGVLVRVTSPIRDAFSGAAARVAGLFEDLGRLNTLRDDNLALLRRVQELETKIAALGNTERENASLREALAYVQAHQELDLVTARVVGRDSVGMLNTLVIDRGASAGVRVGMAVVAQGGLVGRVTGVSD